MINNKTSEHKAISLLSENDVLNLLETERDELNYLETVNIHDIVISHFSKITQIYSTFERSIRTRNLE